MPIFTVEVEPKGKLKTGRSRLETGSGACSGVCEQTNQGRLAIQTGEP